MVGAFYLCRARLGSSSILDREPLRLSLRLQGFGVYCKKVYPVVYDEGAEAISTEKDLALNTGDFAFVPGNVAVHLCPERPQQRRLGPFAQRIGASSVGLLNTVMVSLLTVDNQDLSPLLSAEADDGRGEKAGPCRRYGDDQAGIS